MYTWFCLDPDESMMELLTRNEQVSQFESIVNKSGRKTSIIIIIIIKSIVSLVH